MVNATNASTRRQNRLRREYLYRKHLQGKERQTYEQKRLIRGMLKDGRKILPTELHASFKELQDEMEFEDINTEVPKTHIDDEYGDSGIVNPTVCLTTSRDPSSTLKQFAKELKLMFPHSTRINRGNIKIQDLISSCKEAEFSDIIILHETRGNPDGMVICHLPLGPTAYFTLSNSVLRHDLKTKVAPMSEAYPHVILNNFNTDLGRRIGNVLKCLFPIPKNDTHRIVTFSNDNDFISFRHHVYTKVGFGKVTLHEVGPRFEMRLYQLKLGTVDQKDAESEYILRPYHNTAYKRNVL